MIRDDGRYELVYNNTVTQVPSRMPAATAIIKMAENEYRYASENWPVPLFTFGDYPDPYYAEIWSSGMDWSLTLWLLETMGHGRPVPIPMIHFVDRNEAGRFNPMDEQELWAAICWFRRDSLWVHSKSLAQYPDTVWSHVGIESGTETDHGSENMLWASFEHNSQPKVRFWINKKVVPSIVKDRDPARQSDSNQA